MLLIWLAIFDNGADRPARHSRGRRKRPAAAARTLTIITPRIGTPNAFELPDC
jgi:hypothetical protein